jgi:ParB family transcriptional regulator, chromosome partitioning protein
MAAKKTSKRKPRGVTIEPTGLGPSELALSDPAPEVAALAAQVAADGGQVLASYRDPLGAHALMLVALPIEKVKPTPFQRDVSEPHVKKLVLAMDKTKRFLDPIIAVHQKDIYFTPNGSHRLTALRQLGARSVIALLVPEFAVAYQILALNIEKAHTLRERALEVARMYRDLASSDGGKESDFAFEFEEPTLATLGFAYETRPRLAGGAYHPALRKVDGWFDEPLASAATLRQKRADLLLDLDDAVSETVSRLKAKGLTSPYLKNFVVARVNPLRFIKGELPSLEELMATMTKRARGMNVDKINASDLARSGGAASDEE